MIGRLVQPAFRVVARPAIGAVARPAIGSLNARPAISSLVARHALLSTTAATAKASMLREYLSNKAELFKKLDSDGNGHVDAQELATALQDAGASAVTLDDARSILKQADKDGNGTIEMSELLDVLTKGTLFEGTVLKGR